MTENTIIDLSFLKAMESIRQWEGLLSNAKIICKFVSLDNAFKKEGKVWEIVTAGEYVYHIYCFLISFKKIILCLK